MFIIYSQTDTLEIEKTNQVIVQFKVTVNLRF